MAKLKIFVTVSILLFLYTQSPAKEISEFLLKDTSFTVSISPATFAIILRPTNHEPFTISLPQSDLGSVKTVKPKGDTVAWEYPDKAIQVTAQLLNGDLAIHIQSANDGTFNFPVFDQSSSLKALIWPRWEGCYIPLSDTVWTNYLMDDEWNTTEGLSMPFWGLDYGEFNLTYILTNPYNNLIHFTKSTDNPLHFQFTHEFTPTNKIKEYGFVIHLSHTTSPVESAKVYRNWRIGQGQFVSMKEKIKTIPKAEWLLGAPHVYLWGDALLSRYDIRPNQWSAFCAKLIEQSQSDTPNPATRLKELMAPAHWAELSEISKTQYPGDYLKNEVTDEISRILELPTFYDPKYWNGIALSQEITDLAKQDKNKLSPAQLSRLNSLLLYSSYTQYLLPVDNWGNGVSLKMLKQFQDAGFNRMMLCVGGWSGIEKKPEVARAADKMGYLIGTYDSYFSIHDPKYKGTDSSWETAQFDQNLYDTGGMVDIHGKKLLGFKKFGYKLNPQAARPAVEKRVSENMKNVPYNSYFVDCDAFGEVFDDYSPAHPASQAEYVNAMMDCLAWIRDTYKVVIGSEGGNAYSTPYIHVAEGMFGPGFGWGDPDFKDKSSKYFMGTYFPPDGPRIFLQQVPVKDKYIYLYYDPRFRLPLYETVFHDSVVATNHWGNGSLKFNNILDTVELTELLYDLPPIYHMNLDEFKKYKKIMKKHFDFFSPLNREIGFAPMTDFAWLDSDHLIQQTTFDNRATLIANFGQEPFQYKKTVIPAKSILLQWLDSGKSKIYTAE